MPTPTPVKAASSDLNGKSTGKPFLSQGQIQLCGFEVWSTFDMLARMLALSICILLNPQSTLAQTTPPPTCTGVPSGIVNWWPGDGNNDDIIGGHAANGSFSPGEVGDAFTFDGMHQVSFPTSVSGPGDFTIDFWLKTVPADVTYGVLSNNRSGCGYGSFYEIRTLSSADLGGGFAGHLLVELDQSDSTNYAAIVSAANINNGGFHHIALVRQGGTVLLYIDGNPDSGNSTPGPVNVGSTLVAGGNAR